MHRVKRPPSGAGGFGFSRITYRTNPETVEFEPKVKTGRRTKTSGNFQLNTAGGPLDEKYKEDNE